jgi:uncharacterized protein (TIGR03067 family)
MTWLAAYSCVIDYGHDILYFRAPQSLKSLLPSSQPSGSPKQKNESTRGEAAEIGASDETTQTLVIGSVLYREGYRFARLIRNENSPDLYVNCTIEGKTAGLNVDTGSKQTVLSTTLASELNLSLSKSSKVMYAIGGAHQIQTAPIHALQIGSTKPIAVPQMPFADYSAARAEANKAGGVICDGHLGADILSAYSSVIDIEHGALYCRETPGPLPSVQPDPPPPVDPHIFKSLNGTWRATKIVRDGRAESVETARSVSIAFDHEDCEVRVGETKWLSTFILGNSAWNSIDIYLLAPSGSDKGIRLNGIYDVDKERTKIKVCFSIDEREDAKPTRSTNGGISISDVTNEVVPDRPTKFESTKDDKTVLIEFERSKP